MNEVPPNTRQPFFGRSGGFGAGTGGPAFRAPAIILWTIGLLVVLFVVQSLLPFRAELQVRLYNEFIPFRLTALLETGERPISRTIPLIGHIFAHGNWPHLVFNSLWFLIFGAGVARRLEVESPGGRTRLGNTVVFFCFFLVCGIGGALAYYAFQPYSPIPMVGASGAISGLFAAAMRFALRRPTMQGGAPGPLASFREGPVIAATIIFIAFNLATALGGDGMQIAWEAHIGGYLTGLFLFPYFDRMAPKSRPPHLVGL